MFISFFLMLVYLLMSGLFTPVRSMPTWAQWMAEVNPVKHIIEIMRAVMLKGAGIVDIARPLTILAGAGAAVLTLAAARVTKEGLRRVEEALAALRAAHARGSMPMDADRRFHLSIAEMAGNAVLVDMVGALFDSRRSPIAARRSLRR